MDRRSSEGGDEMGGEFVCGIRVWRRRREYWDVKVVKLDQVAATFATTAKLGLAIVGGGANEVDGYVEGGKEARKVE